MRKLLTLLLILFPIVADAAMLTGQAPGNVSPPSGWSVIREQDFESGSCAYDEYCRQSITESKAHGGSKSLFGTYDQDQDSMQWLIEEGYIGSFTEIYISWYEYLDDTALFNDEFIVQRMSKSGDKFQEINLDWFWAPGFNQPRANLYIVPQGTQSQRMSPKGAYVPNASSSGNVGGWHQWEVHYRPNTPDGTTINDPDNPDVSVVNGSPNGFYRVYLDGELYNSAENRNLNADVDMTNMLVAVGGLYTKGVWTMDGAPSCAVCSTYPGDGDDSCTLPNTGQSFASPFCAPTDPPLASFNKYLDDIIVMTYGGGVVDTDTNPPRSSSKSPASGATGVAVTNREISLTVSDNYTYDTGVVRSSISMTVEGTAYTCDSGLTCTPGSSPESSYSVSRTMGEDWANEQTVNVSFTATDGQGLTLNEAWSYVTAAGSPGAPTITTTTLADGQVGAEYSATISSSGGTSPYTYSLVSGTLPTGLTLPSSGTGNWGSPTSAASNTTYNFTVRVTDSQGTPQTDDQALSIHIAPYLPGGSTTLVGTGIEDTWITSGSQAGVNKSDNVVLRVYNWPERTTLNKTIIMDNSDILALPDNVTINNAKLRLYNTTGAGTDPTTHAIYSLSGTLPDISTVTWNNFSATVSAALTTVSVPAAEGWVEFTVTSAVSAAYLASKSPVYFLIADTEGASDTSRWYASQEHETTAWHPQLEITYTQMVAPEGPSISAPGKMRVSKLKGTFK